MSTSTQRGNRDSSGTSNAKTRFVCEECGWESLKWMGRCGGCRAWGTVYEAAQAPRRASSAGPAEPAVPITRVPAHEVHAERSGVPELDRVLGGGLVPGAVTLLAGEPGVGKSTLLLEVAAQTAKSGGRALYVTGEESASQVRLRADRTSGVHDGLYLAAETDLGAALGQIEQVRPTVLVVDSVQTIDASDTDGVPGGVSQVKEVAAALVRTAKRRNIACVLVGHVTKEGGIAGPRVLEHLVDCVLHFSGERSSRLRLLRAVKNRFGPVEEVGCFELSAAGIAAVADPTGLFVGRHHDPVPGTCVSVPLQGRRPVLAEVQALVAPTASERPQRTCAGLDRSRVSMLLAVLHQRAGVRLSASDVFCSTVGGARVHEPSADLAVTLAVASAHSGVGVPPDVVAVGEVGLAGELRRVPDLSFRLAEAERLGFGFAIVPHHGREEEPSTEGRLQVLQAADVTEALRILDMAGARPRLRAVPGVRDLP